MIQNEKSTRKNIRWYMRYLHNKVGFFIAGLVIIYGLSGILQTYRDTNLLKHEVAHQVSLSGNMNESQLVVALKMKDLKVIKKDGKNLYFKNGNYNAESGVATYTTSEWYGWIIPFTELHKSSSRDIAHYFTTLFGIAMLFMSVSAFWMFKPGTKLFSSGVWLTVSGIIAAIFLLLLH